MKKHKGAASFYIVSIATLLLTITAIGFITLVISESIRTSNNDLSRSAYDSALAGVEDAKVAILNYQSCINQGFTGASSIDANDGVVTCDEVIYYMNHPDCDMVGHILGRIPENDPVLNPNSGSEVSIQEKNISNENHMEQAYTCVKISSNLDNYRAALTAENTTHIVPITIPNPQDVKAVRVSWYSDANGTDFKYNNTKSTGAVIFPRLTASQAATPPSISVELLQTAISFRLSDLDKSIMSSPTTGVTDHGTLNFVPSNVRDNGGHALKTESAKTTSSIQDAMYYDITKDNIITNADRINFATSNDKTSKKVPVTVYCAENSGEEFACSVSIELPGVIPGSDGNTARASDTFMLILSTLYGMPDTDFSVELCTQSDCKDLTTISASGYKVTFGNSQFKIDSTGRANDLYRRVETRMENFDTYYPAASYVVQLLGNDAELVKNIETNVEYGL